MNKERDLEADKPDRFVSPVDSAHRDKVYPIGRVSVWIEADLASQSSVIGKADPGWEAYQGWALEDKIDPPRCAVRRVLYEIPDLKGAKVALSLRHLKSVTSCAAIVLTVELDI